MREVTPAEIERIVREVLAQLAPQPTTPLPTSSLPKTIETSVTELWLEQQVIAVRDLEGRLRQATQIVVPTRAVITPAARDLLREKKINVRRASVAEKKSTERAPLLVGVAETSFDPTTVISELAKRGVKVEQLARTGLKAVVAELAIEVARGGRRAWLFTESTHAAVCLANRQAGVWAASIGNQSELEAARKGIAVNFAITSAKNLATFQLTRMGEALAKG